LVVASLPRIAWTCRTGLRRDLDGLNYRSAHLYAYAGRMVKP
jgi:hypothetical protein